MGILSTGRRRWIVPAAVVAAVAAGVGGTMMAASAEPKLPPRSAAQLLVDLRTADVDGLSGTVVQNADLGLPALPVPGGGQGSSDLASLIAGSHTLRVWYSGADRARVSLLGTLGESDIIRSGRDVWAWSSRDNTADHYVITAGGRHPDRTVPDATTGPMPVTPQDAAQRALEAIDPTTSVTTDGAAKVAGRPAYELVLAPKDGRSLIGEVRLAIDAQNHIPLRVRVIARGKTSPALDVAFTHLSLSRPDDQQFRFTPPPGAKVTEHSTDKADKADKASTSHGMEPSRVVGEGWTRVAQFGGVSLPKPGGVGESGGSTGGKSTDKSTGTAGGAGGLEAVLEALPRVSGPYGTGRMLKSDLFTALLTDDGRLFVGAVGPDLVIQAAGSR